MSSSSRAWLFLPFLFSALAVWAAFARSLASSPSEATGDPSAWIEMQIKDVVPLPEVKTHAVVLASPKGEVLLPIFVSDEIALSVALRLARQKPTAPLAADLLATVLQRLGGRLLAVEIDSLAGEEYSGQITVLRGNERFQVPARPSDVLALALDSGARVFARPKLLQEVGITSKEIEDLRKSLPKGKPPPKNPSPGPGQTPPDISL